MAQNAATKPFGMRDKVGYMFGDLANDMTFMLQSMFLMVFYTEVWHIDPRAVSFLFLAGRIIDAFTDVTMGIIVDKSPAQADGKFKPWIRRIAGPVAIASFLLYQTGLSDMNMTFKIIYMYVTYILYGSIFYTAINIPYGSMQAAMTSNPNERTQLSQYRSMGASLAQLLIGSITPMIIYTNVNGQELVKTDATFTVLAGVFSILAIIFYFICYKNTTERVKVDATKVETNTSDEPVMKQVLSSITETFGALKNRSLLGIIVAALFLLLGQMMLSSINNYVFPNYFNNADGLSILNLVLPLVTLLIGVPIAPRLANKFGKKELAATSMITGGLVFALLFFLRTENMYVYITLTGIGYTGFAMFNTVIWAAITDVVDDIEVTTNNRQDGAVYSLYSFARKAGQAFAGFISAQALGLVGYVSGAAVQEPTVREGIYTLGTLVPSLAFIVCGIALIFIYPLNRKRVLNNAAELEARRNS